MSTASLSGPERRQIEMKLAGVRVDIMQANDKKEAAVKSENYALAEVWEWEGEVEMLNSQSDAACKIVFIWILS